MKYKLRFLSIVEEDVITAFNWYENKLKGLGEDFVQTFYSCCDKLPLTPYLYFKIDDEFHRCLLKRFPYAIYYRIINDEIVIWGIFHCSRDPDVIQLNLSNRK